MPEKSLKRKTSVIDLTSDYVLRHSPPDNTIEFSNDEDLEPIKPGRRRHRIVSTSSDGIEEPKSRQPLQPKRQSRLPFKPAVTTFDDNGSESELPRPSPRRTKQSPRPRKSTITFAVDNGGSKSEQPHP